MKLYDKLAQLHFCADRTNKSQTFRIVTELTQPVRKDVLLEALKKTLALFPVFAERPVITADKKTVGMAENSLPPAVYGDDAPAALGTDETNGYLFRVIAKDRNIILSVFHALCDSHGAHMFMLHLLWYYLTGMGYEIDPEGALLSPDDLSDRSYTDSLEEKLAERGIDRSACDSGAPGPEAIFRDPREEELFDSDVYSFTRFGMPFAELRKLTHELGTTPLLLFYVLGAEAMRETADVGDKVINASFAIDLRSRLGSRSTGEFAGLGNLYYTADNEKLPLSEQLMNAKKALDRITDGDRILCETGKILDGYEEIVKYMDLTMTEYIQPILSKNAKASGSTFFLSNVGPLRFPKDMVPFIKDVQIQGPPARFDPTLSLHTYGDTLYFQCFHNTTDDTFVNRIAEKLNALGVEVTLLEKRTQKDDYLGKLYVE